MRKSLLLSAALLAGASFASAQDDVQLTTFSISAWDANYENYNKIAQDFETELYYAELDDLFEINGWVIDNYMNSGRWLAFTLSDFDADGYAEVGFLDNAEVCHTVGYSGYYAFNRGSGYIVCYAWPLDGPAQADDPNKDYAIKVQRTHLYDTEQSEWASMAWKEKDENGVEQTYVSICAYAYTNYGEANQAYFDGGTGTYYYYVDFMLPNEESGDTTGVTSVKKEDADAPVEYFNLQGVKVDNPENGVFIRRQGSKTSKVFIK